MTEQTRVEPGHPGLNLKAGAPPAELHVFSIKFKSSFIMLHCFPSFNILIPFYVFLYVFCFCFGHIMHIWLGHIGSISTSSIFVLISSTFHYYFFTWTWHFCNTSCLKNQWCIMGLRFECMFRYWIWSVL